ncbi:MAG: mechanosensitive ion channel [Flavobacteriales bacterium]|nr:mechanosensitive ion channel [Flavobacteriales bacterium]MCB9194039.1 mechanosensitive ion channel [Flavobacteriales bacterium]
MGLSDGWTWLRDHGLDRAVTLVLVLVGVLLLVRLLRATLFRRIRDNSARYHANKAASFAAWVLIVLLGIGIFSDRLSGLSVALGVAGAGIAFALQEVIASVAGWMAVLFGGFYSTGDRVQLGGIKGDVIDIGVLRTTVMELGQWVDGDLYNGRIVRIANSFVFKEPVFNYSADFPFVWDELKLPIQFTADPAEVKALLLAAAEDIVGHYARRAREEWAVMVRKYLIEDASTDPLVSLVATDNWVQYVLRYTVDLRLRRSTQSALFERILKDIAATEGRIKFASSTVQLAPGSVVKVEE